MGYIALGDLISKAQVEKCGKREYPVLSMTMHDGIVFQNDRFKKDIASIDRSNYSVVEFNQLVVSFPIDEGVLAVQDITDAGIVSPAYKIWDIDQAKLVPKYLEMWLRSPRSIDYYKSKLRGTTARRRSIPEEDFRGMRVNVPTIEEQKRIVDIITRVKGVVLLREQQLSALDDLIKARFVEMFGDININSKNWPIQPLGDLCTIVRGGSPRPIEQFLGGDIPWIKIGDATEGESIYLTSTKEHIIQDGVKKSRLVKAGSLIFANCGVSLGFARIITFDGCIHDGWLAMEDIDERLDKVFLLQSLNQMTEHFREMAPAGTQPNLNTAIMKAYQQIIPPMDLQKEFITFVEQIDKSKSVIQKALDETQLLFDSLMQKYFG